MIAFLILVLHVLVSPFKTQARLEAEIIMLRHQLNVLRRKVPKPKLVPSDRLLFVWLSLCLPQTISGNNNDEGRRGSAEQRAGRTVGRADGAANPFSRTDAFGVHCNSRRKPQGSGADGPRRR